MLLLFLVEFCFRFFHWLVDPANPTYRLIGDDQRLSKHDAGYVDIIRKCWNYETNVSLFWNL